MPVDFSIKRVPDKLAKRLRERAARHHRSLQGELMAILQDAADQSPEVRGPEVVRETAAPSRYSRYGWKTAPQSESALLVRQMRDGRSFTVEDLLKFVSQFDEGTPDESTRWIRQGRSSQ
jgi:antitoxin FitA